MKGSSEKPAKSKRERSCAYRFMFSVALNASNYFLFVDGLSCLLLHSRHVSVPAMDSLRGIFNFGVSDDDGFYSSTTLIKIR